MKNDYPIIIIGCQRKIRKMRKFDVIIEKNYYNNRIFTTVTLFN